MNVDSAALAITRKTSRFCPNGLDQYNNGAYYVTDIDITLKEQPPAPPGLGVPYCSWNWYLYLTSAMPFYEYDAATILTHEIGHAAGLSHALPKRPGGYNVMYRGVSPQLVQRGYDLDSNSIIGIKHVLSLGDTLGISGGCPSAVQEFPSGCPTVNPTSCSDFIPTGIREISSSSGFKVSLYPNPYQDNTIVHVDVSRYGDYIVIVYDLLGHQIIQRKHIYRYFI